MSGYTAEIEIEFDETDFSGPEAGNQAPPPAQPKEPVSAPPAAVQQEQQQQPRTVTPQQSVQKQQQVVQQQQQQAAQQQQQVVQQQQQQAAQQQQQVVQQQQQQAAQQQQQVAAQQQQQPQTAAAQQVQAPQGGGGTVVEQLCVVIDKCRDVLVRSHAVLSQPHPQLAAEISELWKSLNMLRAEVQAIQIQSIAQAHAASHQPSAPQQVQQVADSCKCGSETCGASSGQQATAPKTPKQPPPSERATKQSSSDSPAKGKKGTDQGKKGKEKPTKKCWEETGMKEYSYGGF